MILEKIKKKIRELLEPEPYKRRVFVFDWFNDLEITKGFVIKPVRAYDFTTIQNHFDEFVNGEVVIDLAEKRIYQKLDGKLIEWKRVDQF